MLHVLFFICFLMCVCSFGAVFCNLYILPHKKKTEKVYLMSTTRIFFSVWQMAKNKKINLLVYSFLFRFKVICCCFLCSHAFYARLTIIPKKWFCVDDGSHFLPKHIFAFSLEQHRLLINFLCKQHKSNDKLLFKWGQ